MSKPTFAVEEWAYLASRNLYLATTKLDRDTLDFAHLIGQQVILDGNPYQCSTVEHFAHVPPYKVGEMIRIAIKGQPNKVIRGEMTKNIVDGMNFNAKEIPTLPPSPGKPGLGANIYYDALTSRLTKILEPYIGQRTDKENTIELVATEILILLDAIESEIKDQK